MMLWEIKEALFKIDTVVQFNEGMDVKCAIFVPFAGNNVFNDTV